MLKSNRIKMLLPSGRIFVLDHCSRDPMRCKQMFFSRLIMIGWRKIDDDLAQVINLEGSSDRKMLASMELIRSHS